jgi:hypothetical protein
MALALASQARADNLSYAVEDGYEPATLKVAGDGTVFVDYANPAPGTYSFTLNVWCEAGGKDTIFPTASCPVDIRKLSGFDASGWFTATPSPVSFSGRGTDPVPDAADLPGYTGVPGGAYESILIQFTIPAGGLPDSKIQTKIQVTTAGVKFLGNGPGIIVRFSKTTSTEVPFTIQSWLSDSSWVPLSDPIYNDTFQVVTKAKSLNVAATNPGSFYYNILVTTQEPVDQLTINVDALPKDFVLWGANAVHAWVGEVDITNPDTSTSYALGHSMTYTVSSVPANTTVFITVHVQFALATLPSSSYLPRVYDFGADATAYWDEEEDGLLDDPYFAESEASMTGVLKK